MRTFVLAFVAALIALPAAAAEQEIALKKATRRRQGGGQLPSLPQPRIEFAQAAVAMHHDLQPVKPFALCGELHGKTHQLACR